MWITPLSYSLLSTFTPEKLSFLYTGQLWITFYNFVELWKTFVFMVGRQDCNRLPVYRCVQLAHLYTEACVQFLEDYSIAFQTRPNLHPTSTSYKDGSYLPLFLLQVRIV